MSYRRDAFRNLSRAAGVLGIGATVIGVNASLYNGKAYCQCRPDLLIYWGSGWRVSSYQIFSYWRLKGECLW